MNSPGIASETFRQPPEKKHLDPKVGYEIGWDYVAYGMLLPAHLRDRKDIVNGYKQAKIRNVKQQPHDRFVRKWLQLRCNAWKRNRMFAPEVTPQFIKEIDVPYCPVTRLKLAHGSGKETDWSVDRINNDGAYAPGNIVVVSVLANISKATYKLEDILEFAYYTGRMVPKAQIEVSRALDRQEWARWAVICSHACAELDAAGNEQIYFTTVPCVIDPPPGLLMNSGAELQQVISRRSYNPTMSRIYNDIALKLPKQKRRLMHAVSNRVEKRSSNQMHGLDIWFNDRVYAEFLEFYKTLTLQERRMVINCRMKDGSLYEKIDESDWGIKKRGFVDG